MTVTKRTRGRSRPDAYRTRPAAVTWTVTILAGCAALVLAAGCATNATGDGSGGPVQAAAAGPAPTGAPIVLGLTNQEGAPTGSWPELRQAAEAAVKYLNTERGGVHGRPLKLDTCVVNGSPESSRHCTEQIMEGQPIAVIGGADLGISASMDLYTKAGMPYLGGMPIDPQQLSAPNSVQFTGFAAGGLPALARYAVDSLHAKKVVIIYPNINSDSAFVMQHFIGSVLRARGATDVKLVPADPRQPDRTSAMMAASQDQPDAIITVEAGAGCTSLLQAHAMLGVTAPLLVTSNCLTAPILRSAGPAAEGAYGESAFQGLTAGGGADADVFRNALARYAPKDIVVGEVAAGGFNAVMNIYTALSALPADQLTSAALLQSLKGAKDAPNFLAHPYTCDGRMKLAPAGCNFADRILRIHNGQLVDAAGDWIDGSSYVS